MFAVASNPHLAICAIWLAGTFAPAGMANSSLPSVLADAYAQAWSPTRPTEFGAPSAEELAATRELFVRLLRGEGAAALERQARLGGWTLRTGNQAGGTITVVSEPPTTARGRGLYAFFSRGRHALQAPHVPTDGLTGEILLRFSADGLPRALAWNTVPRSSADLAHLENTDFVRFALAFAEVHPGEKIMQLHGFDTARRKSAAAAESGAIVSAAHANPSRELRLAVQCLRGKLEPSTSLYGVDVRELGGTTNSIGRALRAAGHDNFIHVEMALALRKRLMADAGQRSAWFSCLGDAS
ncbi:MAG: hypothetical protein ABIQ60_02695 [Burkholderiaceae bacterium]